MITPGVLLHDPKPLRRELSGEERRTLLDA